MKRWFLAWIVAGLVFSASAQVAVPEEAGWREALEGPLRLLMNNNQLIEGEYLALQEKAIRIVQKTGDGEITFDVPLERIVEIGIPGDVVLEEALDFAAGGEHELALVRLDALFRQRLGLFPVLPEKELLRFIQAPLSALETGQPSRAVALSRELRPYLSNPDAIATLRDCELLGLYQLRILSEASPMAREWIDAEPAYSGSALGFMVEAGVEFLRGDFERALWIALVPCVYSGESPMTYLNGCYSIAIASAHALEEEAQRDFLLAEMEQRGLPWLELNLFDYVEIDLAAVPRPGTGTVEEPAIDPLEPLLDPRAELAKLDAARAGAAEPQSALPGDWMPKPRLDIR